MIVLKGCYQYFCFQVLHAEDKFIHPVCRIERGTCADRRNCKKGCCHIRTVWQHHCHPIATLKPSRFNCNAMNLRWTESCRKEIGCFPGRQDGGSIPASFRFGFELKNKSSLDLIALDHLSEFKNNKVNIFQTSNCSNFTPVWI